MARNVEDEIDDLSEKRRRAWSEGDAETAKRIDGQLETLYAEKRAGRAVHGTARARKRLEDRVAAERELDRLMTT